MKLTPGEQLEQDMLHKGPHRLHGTWRTWVRGDGVFFGFITEQKPIGWTPNYMAIYKGGQGKPYPEVRNSRNGNGVMVG